MSLTPSVLKLLAFGLVGCFLQQSLLLVILLALIQRPPTTTNGYNSTGDGSTGGGQAWLAVTAAVTAAGAWALTALALALAAAAAVAQGLKVAAAAAASERRTPHEREVEPSLPGPKTEASAMVMAPAASLPSPPPGAPSPPPTPPLPTRPAVPPAAFCETLAAALEGRAGAPAQPSLPRLARPHPRPAASSPDPAAASKAATPEPTSASNGASPFAIASSPSLPTSSSCFGLGRARPPVASHDPTLDGADSAASAGGSGSSRGGGSMKKRLQHVARALTAPLRRRRTKSSAVPLGPLAAAPEQSLASVSAPPATLVASAAAAEENDVRRQASDSGTSTVEVRGPAAAEAAATARGRHSPASALVVTAKPWPPAPLHRVSAAGRAGDGADAPPTAPNLDVPEAAAAGAEQHGSALTQALPPPAPAAAATAAAASSAADTAAATTAWCAAVPSPSDFAASPDAPLLLTSTFGEPSFTSVTSFTFTPPAAPPAVNSHVVPSTSASSGVQPTSTPQAAQQPDWQQAASQRLPRRVSANDPAVRLRVECGLFSGEALVLVQGLASTPRGLFQGRSRRSWVALQGRFNAPVRLDSLVTGQEFSRPFRRLPPAWMVEWGLLGLARKVSNGAASIGPMSAPSLLMPVIAAASVVNVSEPGSQPPLLEAQEDVRLFAPHLAVAPPHGSPGPSRPADAPTRKRHFSAARHREGLCYDTRHVWTFHFCQQFVDLSAYRLDFGCATYDLARHLDGQPLQFMTKDVDSGSYLFQVQAWHQRLLTEAAAAAGQGADDTA